MKKYFLIVLSICLCFCSCTKECPSAKDQTASAEALQEQTSAVFESVTEDFDGDGTEETFQLRRAGKSLKLWFVGEQGEIPLAQEENFIE